MSFTDFKLVSDPTPIAIYEILNKYLEHGWWEWEPKTLRDEIHGPLPEHRWSVVFAVAATINQARADNAQWLPWNEPDVFGDIAVAFQGIQHNPEYWQKPTLEQIWYANEVLQHIDKKAELEDDVKAYIAACLVENEILYYPLNDDFIDNKMKDLSKRPDLIKEAKETWNSEPLRNKLLARPESSTKGIQVLRMEAARLLVDERIEKGKRQINFVVDNN
jgi:hypothetical protein